TPAVHGKVDRHQTDMLRSAELLGNPQLKRLLRRFSVVRRVIRSMLRTGEGRSDDEARVMADPAAAPAGPTCRRRRPVPSPSPRWPAGSPGTRSRGAPRRPGLAARPAGG